MQKRGAPQSLEERPLCEQRLPVTQIRVLVFKHLQTDTLNLLGDLGVFRAGGAEVGKGGAGSVQVAALDEPAGSVRLVLAFSLSFLFPVFEVFGCG